MPDSPGEPIISDPEPFGFKSGDLAGPVIPVALQESSPLFGHRGNHPRPDRKIRAGRGGASIAASKPKAISQTDLAGNSSSLMISRNSSTSNGTG